jgi:hypothetical protein
LRLGLERTRAFQRFKGRRGANDDLGFEIGRVKVKIHTLINHEGSTLLAVLKVLNVGRVSTTMELLDARKRAEIPCYLIHMISTQIISAGHIF